MTRTLILVFAGAAAALLAAVLLVMLRPGAAPEGEHHHQHGDGEYAITGPVPAGAGPGLAAQQGLITAFSWRPVTDPSPGAALTRAKPWLAGSLAAQADTPPAADIKPLPEWARWRQSGDIVVATARTNEVGTAAGGRVTVSLALTQTVLHADGTSTRWRIQQIEATAVETVAGWRLADFRVTR